ncbi:MAG TPA: DoxX family protein [Croceibacterium sp.]|nr:DoxX family protein [Croceibacterium sp.]
MSLIAAVIGRLLLALLFIVAGLQKIVNSAAVASMFVETNLSTSLIVPIGIFELVAGILLAIGLMTRLVSFLLFLWVVLEIFFFYNQFTDPVEGTMALLLAAVAGGLLMVFAYGQMRGSYDYMRERRRTYEAELRAARAEGRAEGATTAPRVVTTDVDGDGIPEARPRRRWF